jgi:hypothetical protein
VGKNRDVRMLDRQVVKVYSSQGAPTLKINGEQVAVRMLSPGVFATDTLSMHGRNHITAEVVGNSDSMVLTVGNYLKK